MGPTSDERHRVVERGESTDYLADACQVSPETAAEWMDEIAGRVRR